MITEYQINNQVAYDHFKDIQYFVNLASKSDIDLSFDFDSAWNNFTSFPSSKQLQIAESFRIYLATCQQTVENGFKLTNSKQMIWSHLKRFKLSACDDLFDKLEDGYVTEIYDSNFRQIFRSLAFFQVTSYSLPELLHYQWPELYERPLEVSQTLLSKVTKVYSGQITNTVFADIPDHYAQETRSINRYLARIKLGIMSPLYDIKSKKVSQFLGTLKIELVNN